MSLYRLRVPPCLRAGHLGAQMRANGFRRSMLDPAFSFKGVGTTLTCTTHVDSMVTRRQTEAVEKGSRYEFEAGV